MFTRSTSRRRLSTRFLATGPRFARRILPHLMASLLLTTPALAAELPLPPTPPAHKPLRKSVRTPRSFARATPQTATVPYLADGQARLLNAAYWRPEGAWHQAPLGWEQVGLASWYGGPRWQGRRTASGTVFNEHELTAAHATLPLGSQVMVTVPATGRSVVVTITDRPGTRSRIIDLSRAAAAELGILRQGVAKVELSRL